MINGRSILVLAPHPDDEVVGAAIAIGRAVARGAEVRVLHLTTGVPAAGLLWPWQRSGYQDRVERRRFEAETAAAALGATLAGFADRPTRSLKDHLAAALAEVRAALGAGRADRLWVPAFEGAHQDHDAANLLGACLAREIAVWEFAEYNFCHARVNRNRFPEPHGDEQTLTPSPEEAAIKQGLLRVYASERGNLGVAGSDGECFRRLGGYDYHRPAHGGRLFWTRFQWVPFRHPRVDFTPPAAVCQALGAFAEAHGLGPGLRG
jgi:LmbE family N-acetylglucosaminyl deacetylase